MIKFRNQEGIGDYPFILAFDQLVQIETILSRLEAF